ncbi:MAG: hypothetical protein OEY95_05640 [Candidatus Bathyarchaeota archaeon]|nr:hypothetical protein [Candidatus Bathyarchaeota archaeon]MDH5754666.1 hypothetical protein [Candidatus Bathyarchaeota archaeon]
MITPPTSTTLITLCFGVLIFIFIMFLPALLELKKPKDAGPRMILNDVSVLQQLQIVQKIPIANMEEDLRFDQTVVKKIANVIAMLPNLET